MIKVIIPFEKLPIICMFSYESTTLEFPVTVRLEKTFYMRTESETMYAAVVQFSQCVFYL